MTTRTAGNRSRTASTVPSWEALSTMTVFCRPSGKLAAIDSRQMSAISLHL